MHMQHIYQAEQCPTFILQNYLSIILTVNITWFSELIESTFVNLASELKRLLYTSNSRLLGKSLINIFIKQINKFLDVTMASQQFSTIDFMSETWIHILFSFAFSSSRFLGKNISGPVFQNDH